jgi:hypothetical protein
LPRGGRLAREQTTRSFKMFRSIVLWMLGIPIPIIILLWLFLD